jgi:uncharacterized repeat protein (TIGR03803 family)
MSRRHSTSKAYFGALVATFAAILTVFSAVGWASAASFSSLYKFPGGAGGYKPSGNLILINGWLYGTTQLGGDYDGGTIYKFNPATKQLVILYSFSSLSNPSPLNFYDGCYPQGGVSYPGKGSQVFGTASECGNKAYGTAFVFDFSSNTLTPLHRFNWDGDGLFPGPAPIFGPGNQLYDVTTGGPYRGATLFSLGRDGSFVTLHLYSEFASHPGAAPTLGSHSILFGSTENDGDFVNCFSGCGTLYAYDLKNASYTTVYTFHDKSDGGYPSYKLISDGNGNLYGGTSDSGKKGGVIFKISDGSSGPQTPTVVYTFGGNGDGRSLDAELTLDPATGTFVGVSDSSFLLGKHKNAGAVFRFDPTTKIFTVLHAFPTVGNSGRGPQGALLPDGAGNFFGVTTYGGPADFGTIYKITP